MTQHFLKDGALTGIFLTEPKRFNHDRYVKDRERLRTEGKEEKPDKLTYWQSIPSENLYFFADKIFNMNLTYKSPSGKIVDEEVVRKLINEIMGSALTVKNITITQAKTLEKDEGTEEPE